MCKGPACPSYANGSSICCQFRQPGDPCQHPELRVGAIARLASGGPLMTVEDVPYGVDRVTCAWHAIDHTLQRSAFPKAALRVEG